MHNHLRWFDRTLKDLDAALSLVKAKDNAELAGEREKEAREAREREARERKERQEKERWTVPRSKSA
jgi:hypothetical protein